MGDRDLGEARYRAFLSYSHKDAAPAGRLHRRLEAYRIPRRLAGRETARGPVPARLWPIFRDREELPAATDLSETVREALARSDALIVLCSQDAAASLWVAEEIRVFRELHPDRPILAAILEGDPPDCFPDLLRAPGDGHEPLATDLRRQRDGERLGLLKLVAGITGLGLDDLVQRDATRRVRRVMAVTAGAIVAMLVMAVLTWFAIDARRDAEQQRAEAKGQSEFMLTDLRQRLREVGRLDIMSAVNRRALAYYDRQSDLDAHDTAMRARVLQALGEDDLIQSREAAALSRFQEAYRTTSALIEAEPDNSDIIYAHAQSEYWLGEYHARRREWRPALIYFERYAAAAERLVTIAPANPDYLMEAGYGASNIGRTQLRGLENPVAAQRSFSQALRWFERSERARPGDQTARRKQANAYAWLADTFYARGQLSPAARSRLFRESLAARLRQYAISEALSRSNPADMELLFDLVRAQRSVGVMTVLVSDRQAGVPHLLRALENARRLVAHDPSNQDWLVMKATITCDLLGGASLLSPPIQRQLHGELSADGDMLAQRHNPNVGAVSCLDRARPDSGHNAGRAAAAAGR
jgi:tetratricopeptide (TPR) repeat protein